MHPKPELGLADAVEPLDAALRLRVARSAAHHLARWPNARDLGDDRVKVVVGNLQGLALVRVRDLVRVRVRKGWGYGSGLGLGSGSVVRVVRVRVRVSNLGELAAVVRLQDSGCSVDCEDVEKREGDGVVALGRDRAVVVQLDACVCTRGGLSLQTECAEGCSLQSALPNLQTGGRKCALCRRGSTVCKLSSLVCRLGVSFCKRERGLHTKTGQARTQTRTVVLVVEQELERTVRARLEVDEVDLAAATEALG